MRIDHGVAENVGRYHLEAAIDPGEVEDVILSPHDPRDRLIGRTARTWGVQQLHQIVHPVSDHCLFAAGKIVTIGEKVHCSDRACATRTSRHLRPNGASHFAAHAEKPLCRHVDFADTLASSLFDNLPVYRIKHLGALKIWCAVN